MKYKVGDKVKMTEDRSCYGFKKGDTATIVVIDTKDEVPYGLMFDKDIRGGHSLTGSITNRRGLYLTKESIELVHNEDLELGYDELTLEELKDIQREISPLISKLSSTKEEWEDITHKCIFTVREGGLTVLNVTYSPKNEFIGHFSASGFFTVRSNIKVEYCKEGEETTLFKILMRK